jgi:hypothetical protein
METPRTPREPVTPTVLREYVDDWLANEILYRFAVDASAPEIADLVLDCDDDCTRAEARLLARAVKEAVAGPPAQPQAVTELPPGRVLGAGLGIP